MQCARLDDELGTGLQDDNAARKPEPRNELRPSVARAL